MSKDPEEPTWSRAIARHTGGDLEPVSASSDAQNHGAESRLTLPVERL